MINEFEKKCCFTGYRPGKFPFLLSERDEKYLEFENALIEAIFSMPENECFTFYSGMAMGFDIIAAEIVLLLKRAEPSVKLICALPYPEQGKGFGDIWRQRFDKVISLADEVVCLSGSYHNGCYAVRNKFMVDNSDFVLTWYDGKPGGTGNTLKYAAKKGRHIINLNEDYTEYGEQMLFSV